jgi:hypothetical protein
MADYIKGGEELDKMFRSNWEYSGLGKLDGHIPREQVVKEFTAKPPQERVQLLRQLDGYLRQENVPASAVRDVSRVHSLRRALGDRHHWLRRFGR